MHTWTEYPPRDGNGEVHYRRQSPSGARVATIGPPGATRSRHVSVHHAVLGGYFETPDGLDPDEYADRVGALLVRLATVGLAEVEAELTGVPACRGDPAAIEAARLGLTPADEGALAEAGSRLHG